MKKMFLVLLLSVISPWMLLGQTKWQQTAGSVSFAIKNRGSNVNGRFGGLKTTLVFSPEKLSASSLKGSVDVSTINTGNGKRDKDLKEENYFDAGKHTTIEVVSTKLAKKGAQYTGTFNVTMKGITRQVEIPFDFIEKGNTGEFKSNFSINRRDFGIGGKSGLAFFMADDAHVTIDIKARR
jgi:polyisoprenoid-binding protein YceI